MSTYKHVGFHDGLEGYGSLLGEWTGVSNKILSAANFKFRTSHKKTTHTVLPQPTRLQHVAMRLQIFNCGGKMEGL